VQHDERSGRRFFAESIDHLERARVGRAVRHDRDQLGAERDVGITALGNLGWPGSRGVASEGEEPPARMLITRIFSDHADRREEALLPRRIVDGMLSSTSTAPAARA